MAISGDRTTTGRPDVTQWAETLGRHLEFEGLRREGHDLQGAVFEVGAIEAFQRRHGGEQRRHPDDPGSDTGKKIRIGTDAKREDRHGDDKEHERERRIAAAPGGERKVAPDESAEGRHGDVPRLTVCASSRAWAARTATPPRARCPAISSSQPGGRVGIEIGRRFVQDPAAAGTRRHARQGQPARLSGRQHGRREVVETLEVQRLAKAGGPVTPQEGKVLAHRQGSVDGIEMPEKHHLPAPRLRLQAGVESTPGDPARGGSEQAGHDAEQAALAAAVGALDDEGVSCVEGDCQSLEEQSPATLAGKVADDKPWLTPLRRHHDRQWPAAAPPSSDRMIPVARLASSQASHRMPRATSPTVPMRPMGTHALMPEK